MGANPALWLEDGPAIAVAETVRVLKQGGVVLFPTDTVYGLLASAVSAQAYAGIYRIKGRAASNPLQLLVQQDAPLTRQASSLLEGFTDIRERFLAGMITLVVDKLAGIPAAVSAIQPGSAGLRVPLYPPLASILDALGPPHLLWATSANASGGGTCATAAQAQHWLATAEALPQLAVLSRTPCAGTPSTVIRLSGSELIVLR